MGKVACGTCKKSCKGQAVRVGDKYFHVKCFKCKECSKQLAAGGFYTKDDKFYCGEDYQRLFGTKCEECGKYVEGEVVTALGNTYHQQCFHCTKCRNKFGAGDKVTYTGQDYMCTKCLEKYEATISGAPKEKTKKPIKEKPVAEEQIKPVYSSNAQATSTPARPLSNDLSPGSDSGVPGGGGGYQNGHQPISPISVSYQHTSYSRQHEPSAGELSDDPELGSYLGAPHETSQTDGQRLSPIQQIMQYRSYSPASMDSRSSRCKTPESTGSYEPKYDVDYGRFYKKSYLKPDNVGYKRGPSINPPEHKPRSPHFHRPENFSYSQVRRDFIKPIKKESSTAELVGDTENISKRHQIHEPVEMNNEEPIELAKIPDASHEHHVAPIERDDWPSPPAPAAAYPELLRDDRHSLPRGKSAERTVERDDVDGEEEKYKDPRTAKLQQSLGDSGVGKVILRDMERKRSSSPTLDPRSASRTPSAKREPPYKTRYESPVFASPSRDLDLRHQEKSKDDDFIGFKYRNSTLPSSNLAAPRPGYGLTSPKSSTLPANPSRASSYDPYEAYRDDKENGEPCDSRSHGDSRSHRTSQSSLEDDYDPETGLRKARRNKTTSSFNYRAYVAFHRSLPNVMKMEEPPLIYPYEQLLINNFKHPPGVDRNSLECHLSKDEFESIFHMTREDFYRMAEWKRNDLKKRVGLY